MPKDTLDEALKAALEEASGGEQEEAPEQAQEPEEPSPEPEEPAEQEAPQEKQEEEQPARTKAPKAPSAAEAAKPPTPKKGAAPPATPGQPGPAAANAPRSWAPATREQWASLPRPVKDQILKREGEFSRTLQEVAQVRQGYERVQKVLQPFIPHLQAAGVDPLQHMESLFRNEYTLRSGTPAQKALLFTQLMGTYNVDVDHINQVLDGKAPPPGAQPEGQFRDPRLDTLLGQLQQASTAREAKTKQQQQQELNDFAPTAEFFDDVLPEMIEVEGAARARGQKLTLQQTYDKACLLNDSVRTVLEQRKAEDAKRKQAQKAQQARYAAGSVQSEPSPPAGKRRPTLEETLWAGLNGQ